MKRIVKKLAKKVAAFGMKVAVDVAILAFCAVAIRPMPAMSPSALAAEYRILHQVYCSERPGRWDNTVFPYQAPLMDMVEEAVRDGKRGVCYMKSGQGGGSDLAINGAFWCKCYLPGPQLFLTATEQVASEFGRERFGPIIEDFPPLLARYLPNPRGDIMTKRFSDGKIQLCGGQSVFKLQSTPYRVVVIDELDSLSENLGGEGDPLKLAEVRQDSFTGQTLTIAYAHPTTRDRGAAKLYFESTDQRRGFVKHDCGGEFYLQWEHVKCAGDAKDAGSYSYVCPHCGAVVSDEERVRMIRGVAYRSVLQPEEAKKRTWIGAHFSQLYYPSKTIRSIAQRWIECGDDENAKRVFWNKILGEPYEAEIKKIELDDLRSLIVVKRRPNDPEFYSRGQVPPGVRFLTAGQDSNESGFHYAIWGWGLRRASETIVHECGWLIDWGHIRRTKSNIFTEDEYHVFDDLIYRRVFYTLANEKKYIEKCAHDISYPPTETSIKKYCRNFTERAIPTRGLGEVTSSLLRSEVIDYGRAEKFKLGEAEFVDQGSRVLRVNGYKIKTQFFGWASPSRRIEIPEIIDNQIVGAKKVGRITFPEDVDEDFLKQSSNEALVKGGKSNEELWKKTGRGENHFGDCNFYAMALAHQIGFFQNNLTAEEARARLAAEEAARARAASEPNIPFLTPDGRPYFITER